MNGIAIMLKTFKFSMFLRATTINPICCLLPCQIGLLVCLTSLLPFFPNGLYTLHFLSSKLVTVACFILSKFPSNCLYSLENCTSRDQVKTRQITWSSELVKIQCIALWTLPETCASRDLWLNIFSTMIDRAKELRMEKGVIECQES